MRKVYLFCNAGMSTSLMASKMQKVADDHKIPVEVKAFPDGQIDKIVAESNPDVILLGPQVKYLYEKITDKYGDSGKLIDVIDQEDYGSMNGERVLKQVLINLKKQESEKKGK
ncbi:MAG: PTS sugar transporter subunit IIB [Erysipelotrichaceae bacterium]|nr:PTS sugar transporter subunit IIB [Erysipelotrichaceae bacterium]